MKSVTIAALALATLGLIGAGAWLWRQGLVPPAAPSVPSPMRSVATEPVLAPPTRAASEPSVKHPVDAPVATAPPSAPVDMEAALAELFGRKAVLSMFDLRDLPRRLVATVDNLGRSHAPASMWPVNPTAGRFVVEKRNGAEFISADNGLRYSPYLLLIETVDLRQLVALYVRFYPVLQQAYVDIGYPNRYFNDRLVEVIDQLLATPELNEPLKIRLPVVAGPVQPERPWVMYEFAAPGLQSLSAGQKLLLRMGPVNQRRARHKLVEIRRLVTASALPR